MLYDACVYVLSFVANNISSIEETYEGSIEFEARYVRDVFRDKKCNFTAPHDGGIGISQNDSSVPASWRMDLSKEDWFVYEDNYGTSEEKAFVAYFKKYAELLRERYNKVYLVRNERQLHTYSFESGERFEPDYLLFLQSSREAGFEQLQVFIEAKGAHLLTEDAWKEQFLIEMGKRSVPVITFVDDNDYKIWGLHFFNQEKRAAEFKSDMDRILAHSRVASVR